MFGAVFVDAAQGVASVIFDEKGAFEQEFAAVATLVAFSLSVFFLLRDVGFAKSHQEITSHFADGLFAHFAEGFGHGNPGKLSTKDTNEHEGMVGAGLKPAPCSYFICPISRSAACTPLLLS